MGCTSSHSSSSGAGRKPVLLDKKANDALGEKLQKLHSADTQESVGDNGEEVEMPDVDDEEDLTKGHYRIINGYVLKTHDRDKAKRTIYINIFKCAELEVNHVVVDNVTTWKSKADSTRSTVLSIIVSTPTFHKAQLNTGFKPIFIEAILRFVDIQCPDVHINPDDLEFVDLKKGYAGEHEVIVPRTVRPSNISLLFY